MSNLASLTAREISLAAGRGPPLEDLAPLKHMMIDLSQHLGCNEAIELSDYNFSGIMLHEVTMQG